jgi:hypothetical protein
MYYTKVERVSCHLGGCPAKESGIAGETACATTSTTVFQKWGRRFRLPIFSLANSFTAL